MPLQVPGRPLVALQCAAGVALVAFLDYATGVELRIDPLYFVPVGFAGWRLGRKPGLAFAALAAPAAYVSNLLAGAHGPGAVTGASNTALQLAGLLAVALLASRLQESLERQKALTRVDDLTGLANLDAFRERAVLEVERARRWSRPLTLAYLDLDSFKALNEDFGHEIGDEILRTIAVSLRSAIRATDLAARIGVDEFVLLLPEADKRGARVVLERVLEEVQQDLSRGGWPVTVSSCSVTASDAEDGESLLRQARRKMDNVKKSRKDGARGHEPAPAGPQD